MQQVIESLPNQGFLTDITTPNIRALTAVPQRAVETAVADAAATQTTPQRPTRDLVGAEVFYVLPDGRSIGQRRPATVVRDNGGDMVNLNVDTDWTNDYPSGTPGSYGSLWATSVHYAPAEAKTPGTWHWRSESF